MAQKLSGIVCFLNVWQNSALKTFCEKGSVSNDYFSTTYAISSDAINAKQRESDIPRL